MCDAVLSCSFHRMHFLLVKQSQSPYFIAHIETMKGEKREREKNLTGHLYQQIFGKNIWEKFHLEAPVKYFRRMGTNK